MTEVAPLEQPEGVARQPGAVIDLREAAVTRVRIDRGANPFDALPPAERMKLIIRVLCELVAYGEVTGDDALLAEPRPDPTARSG